MTRLRTRRSEVVAIAVALVAVALVAVGCSSTGDPIVGSATRPAPPSTPPPNQTVISYGGQFLSSCPLSHTATNDPIMHRDHPGASHQHEFFGNASTDASSTYASMIGQPSTCSDDGDRSAYWVPALTIDGTRVVPRRVDAYYRAGPGVAATEVQPYPDGLEILAGNQHSTEPEPLTVAAWSCGLSPSMAHEPPQNCTPDRPVQLRLTFPSCWDGTHIRSADHTSHMAYPSSGSGCDAAHPIAVPQLTLTVHYPFSGTYRRANIASGGFDTTHGDFLAAWQDQRIAAQVKGCLNREVTCGIVGGTFHTGQGTRDLNSYNLAPDGAASTVIGGYDDGATTTTMDPPAMAQMDH